MRWVLAGVIVALGGCASSAIQLPPKTVTITKTVPVYPPEALFSAEGGCSQIAVMTSGTVRDLANAMIDERASMDVCLGDRAALRSWYEQVKAIK